MNILHLKYAVEVERAGSITQAADNLYMAQPNLSKALRELESELNITIFERMPRGVVPTPKGVEFLARARNVLAEIESMKTLRKEDGGNARVFSLSIPRGSYIAEGFLNFVSGLDLEKPMDLRIKETNSVEAIHNVADGRFRMGIIRYSTVNEPYFVEYMKEKNVRFEPVWTFENILLMSKANPLAAAEKIGREDLAGQIEIVHGDNLVPYMPEEEGPPAAEGRSRHICVYERSTQFDLLDCVPSTYMWVSPLPETVLSKRRLVQRSCAFATQQMKDVLIYSKRYKLTALDKRFVDCLFSVRNQIVFLENGGAEPK